MAPSPQRAWPKRPALPGEVRGRDRIVEDVRSARLARRQVAHGRHQRVPACKHEWRDVGAMREEGGGRASHMRLV